MVAQIFTDIAHFEIRVVWCNTTTGYVNGVRFQIENEDVIFPNHPTLDNNNHKKATRNLSIALRRAVRLSPEFKESKRESKAHQLMVTNGNFPGLYNVNNPLNGSIYNVVLHPNKTYCECADHQFRNTECKHIRAVKKHINTPPVPRLSWESTKKPIYRVVTDLTEAQIADAKASLGW